MSLRLLDLPALSNQSLSLWCSPPWLRPESLSEDLLWTGPAVCADGGNRPRRVRLPGKMSPLLCSGVRLRRQVLREPLRGVLGRLPGAETDLRGAQQGLLLQRYTCCSDAAQRLHSTRRLANLHHLQTRVSMSSPQWHKHSWLLGHYLINKMVGNYLLNCLLRVKKPRCGSKMSIIPILIWYSYTVWWCWFWWRCLHGFLPQSKAPVG